MQKQLPQRQLSQRGATSLQQQSFNSKRRKPGSGAGNGGSGGAGAGTGSGVGPATVRRQVSWGPPIVAETDVDLANSSGSGSGNSNGNRKTGGKQNGYHGVNRRATTTRN